MQLQIQCLDEFAHRGFTVEHPHVVIIRLCHQGEPVGRIRQPEATEQRLQAECARHLAMKHGWDGCLWSRKE